MSVPDILKVGFSGFAFLVVYLSYRLEEKNPSRSKSAFARQGIILAVLVVLAGFVDKLIAREDPTPHLAQCRGNLEELLTFARMPNVDAARLRTLIESHAKPCEQTLAKLNVR